VKRELKQRGYDFFKNSQELANAPDNLPVGSDYRIGPGDTLKVDLWGGLLGRYELTVDRNGEIAIPKVGTVKVWGLTQENAKGAIQKSISRYFKGFEMNLTLGKLRMIQVYIVGEVTSPGMYSVSSVASVLNALAAAGGPTKSGTLRSIRISRDGKLVKEIDLYDIISNGDRINDIRLENGDTIFVPVIGPVFAVAGEVKRPSIYEMKGKCTLAEALNLAGGITAAGDTGRIQVERIEQNSSKVIIDFVPKERDLATLEKIELHDRDMIKVFPVMGATRKVVSLQGNVFRPGDYQFHEGMTIRDIITGYDLLLPDSYLESAAIVRLKMPDRHREVVSFHLGKVLDGDAVENIPLQEQDTIKIYSRWDMKEKEKVGINGQVVNPGVYDFYPNMTIRELVVAAGSLKRNAFLDSAELTRVTKQEGKAKSTRISIDLAKALSGDPHNNLTLLPDDVLIVRGVEEWLDAHDRFVTLKGEVKYPGTYSISKGELLSSVILRAGGYTDKAYLLGSKFTRRSVRETQQKRMNEIVTRTEKEILQKQGELASLASTKEELEATKASLEGLLKNLENMKTLKAEGRVVIRLSVLNTLEKSPYDLALEGGDTLSIPTRSSVVNVMGEIFNPTALVFMPEKSVSYYINKSGGITRNGDEDEMYIVKADGTVFSRQQSSFGFRWDEDTRSWTGGSFMSSRMDAGDTVVVPEKIERVAWLRTIKDITTIVSQIALTAGTIMIGTR
jgi:protein involved in polysaccharide export with SLBB domain